METKDIQETAHEEFSDELSDGEISVDSPDEEGFPTQDEIYALFQAKMEEKVKVTSVTDNGARVRKLPFQSEKQKLLSSAAKSSSQDSEAGPSVLSDENSPKLKNMTGIQDGEPLINQETANEAEHYGKHLASLKGNNSGIGAKSLNRKQLFPKRTVKGDDYVSSSKQSSNEIEPNGRRKLNKRKNTPMRVMKENSISDHSSDEEEALMDASNDSSDMGSLNDSFKNNKAPYDTLMQVPVSLDSSASHVNTISLNLASRLMSSKPYTKKIYESPDLLRKPSPQLIPGSKICSTSQDPPVEVDEMMPKFRCPVCNQAFIGWHIMNAHVRGHDIRERKSFTCDICGKTFRRQKYLNKHMKLHANSEPLPHCCATCGKSFGSPWKLRRHERIHRERPHRCIVCLKNFGRRSTLLQHIQYFHTDVTIYTCIQCGQIFASKKRYDQHMEKGVHKNPETNPELADDYSDSEATIIDESENQDSQSLLGENPKNREIKSELKKEIKKEPESPENVENNNSDGQSNSENSMDPSNASSNSSEQKMTIDQNTVNIKKEIMDSNSTRKTSFENSSEDDSDEMSDLEGENNGEVGEEKRWKPSAFPKIQLKDSGKHKLEEQPDESDEPVSESDDTTKAAWLARGEFTCYYCSLIYTDYAIFQTHIHEHAMTKPFICDLCGKALTSNTSLKRHMITHKAEKPCTCDICGKGFVHNCDLQDHRRTHTGERPYVCGECGKDFATRNNFNGHLRIHSRIMKHFCPHCGKGFICKRALRRHLYTHTTERPFQCDLCTSTFKDVHSLRRHVKRHDNIMTHMCAYCDRGFSHSTDWKRHVRTHTGERPFKCHLCGRGFKQNHHLSDHMRTHTGEKPFICQYCPQKCSTKAALMKHLRRHRPGGDMAAEDFPVQATQPS